jgi:uncharacterized protein YndB with AHSA1/START domain
MKQLMTLAAAILCSNGALADVTDSAENGFTTVHEVIVDAARPRVWQAAVEEIGQWWSDDHTVDGSAARLSINGVPHGCFCETFENGGGVVHMTVTFVNPGVILRLTGGLGPLGLMGVNGNMTWEFFDSEEGTRVKFTYVVGGYRPGGLDAIAIPVDYVIGEALARMRAYVETGDPGRGAVE